MYNELQTMLNVLALRFLEESPFIPDDASFISGMNEDVNLLCTY